MVRDVSKRLGSKSPNAYAQYERGRLSVTLEKYEELPAAVSPLQHRHIRLGIVQPIQTPLQQTEPSRLGDFARSFSA